MTEIEAIATRLFITAMYHTQHTYILIPPKKDLTTLVCQAKGSS